MDSDDENQEIEIPNDLYDEFISDHLDNIIELTFYLQDSFPYLFYNLQSNDIVHLFFHKSITFHHTNKFELFLSYNNIEIIDSFRILSHYINLDDIQFKTWQSLCYIQFFRVFT